ncbi:hypothetical protein OSB04_013344 [Centaurea solstitialis]|uniref:ADP-ribosyl cyclase/cyclic ADP-ribose hydrolase n=1 Tax=Centaurea solstitialis TaxID=347529 RepID=A0AA38TPS2_9ASTR|nr:hypothetical protein OSB04_013344 [Centaurea solstitialis]
MSFCKCPHVAHGEFEPGSSAMNPQALSTPRQHRITDRLLGGSTSSSSSPLDPRYDVFLSFRGSDTRFSFTDHLYERLNSHNITTFLDDEEIKTGASLKPKLESAIKASQASIIVLSKNYASSTWCLDELALILEQQLRNPNYVVIPIFYHVEPTDVRKQQNSFGEAMEKHKQRMKTETDPEKINQLAKKIERWREALSKVADLKGETAQGRKETDLIKQIVTNIHHSVDVLLSCRQPPPIFGRHYEIKYITTWLKDGSSHTVDVLTISGISGIGKTTLAKYVYWWSSCKCRDFSRSFIDDIRGTCERKHNGLLDLQKQICGDILKTKPIRNDHVENALADTKVFLVLDDVDSHDQLDALLGSKGLYRGSKVIITTRDGSLTERCRLFNPIVQPKHKKYLLQGLDVYSSLKLFSDSAFKCNSPKEGYEEVSDTLAKYCEGHPLALKVLGASLCGRDVAVWKDCIDRLKVEPDSRIKKALQMSFDSLPSIEDKELFKHIACFFVGEDRESTETILKACGFRTKLGIENLNDRCLLWINYWDKQLMMHQLLQEFGIDLVRQESPNRPEERSRLCCHEESFEVLKFKKGKGNILALALDMRMLKEDKLYELDTDAFSNMDNLKFLQLNYVHKLTGSVKNLPQDLKWLCMHGFPLEHIPPDLQLENLVGLDMSYSRLVSFNPQRLENMQKSTKLGSIFQPLSSLHGLLKLPIQRKRQESTELGSKDKPLLRSLKTLNLSYCEHLRSLGGFSEFPALESLILSNCTSLIELCESIQLCDELEHIDLSYCNEAAKLLRMSKVRNVKKLNLEGCNLGGVQTDGSHLVIPRDIRSVWSYLPSSLVCLSLKDNHLSNESFPMDMSSLIMLKDLCLDGNDIVSMPDCVRTLPRLEKLSIYGCARLTTIEHPPRTLKELIFSVDYEVGKVVFHEDMSPIKLIGSGGEGPFIEGLFKEEDMADVKEKLLHRLGWSNLDFTNIKPVANKVQMLYEFGIFSTFYVGKEIPNWISKRSEGSSISFTIPPSPNQLRGLNFCFVLQIPENSSLDARYIQYIKISNITKNHTWIYSCPVLFIKIREGKIVHLSHWMFGKNEMEDGDQISISILDTRDFIEMECGMELMYDDDVKNKMEEEEDVLSYYKSWNHIIGGDLSPFQKTTPGEYELSNSHFLGYVTDPEYVDKRPLFRASPPKRYLN